MRRQVLLTWFFVFIIWALYRANFNLPDVLDEFIIKPLVFIAPVLFIVLIREKKNLEEIGLGIKTRGFIVDAYIGVVLGILFAVEGLLANFFKYGSFSLNPLDTVKISGGIYIFLLTNLATSVSEEVLGRGYIYKRLFKISGNQLWASIYSSFMFTLLHIPIMFTRLHLTGASLFFYPVSIMVMGITNCYLFSLRKTLTLPILVHTFWNMTVALYL